MAGTPPRGEIFISGGDLAAAAGITAVRLAELVELGLIEPITPDTNEFPAADAVRLRRMLRLHADLGVDLDDATIIVELLERLDALEAELTRLRTASAT